MSDLVPLLVAARERFVAAVRAVPADRWHQVPAAGGWSAAQVTEHVVLVDRIIGGMVASAEVQDGIPEGASAYDGDGIRTFVLDRSQHPQAPEPVLPSAQPADADTLLAQYDVAHANLVALAEREGATLERRWVPHFRFGVVDGRRWLQLLAAHAERHAEQVEQAAGLR